MAPHAIGDPTIDALPALVTVEECAEHIFRVAPNTVRLWLGDPTHPLEGRRLDPNNPRSPWRIVKASALRIVGLLPDEDRSGVVRLEDRRVAR